MSHVWNHTNLTGVHAYIIFAAAGNPSIRFDWLMDNNTVYVHSEKTNERGQSNKYLPVLLLILLQK